MLRSRQRIYLLALGLLLGIWYASALAQTAGCGLPAMPGVSTVTLSVNGVQRSYLLSVPSTYSPTVPSRLVFAWHGLGGSGQTMRSHNVEYGLSGISVYPNALPCSQFGGQTCWDLNPMGQDMAFYDAMLAHLEAQFCINPQRIVDYGFSMGGAMTNLIACVRQGSTRAVAVDAGWLPDAGGDGPVSYWAEHADDDQAVPIAAGLQAKEFWRNMDSCSTATPPVSPSPCVAYTGCQPGYAVTWCELSSGGHTWYTWTSQAIAAFLSQY